MKNDIRPPRPRRAIPSPEPIQIAPITPTRGKLFPVAALSALIAIIATAILSAPMTAELVASRDRYYEYRNPKIAKESSPYMRRISPKNSATPTPTPTPPPTPDPVRVAAAIIASPSKSKAKTKAKTPASNKTTVTLLPVFAASVLGGLNEPMKKEIAMQLVSSAENSSLNWKEQYGYIEDIGDGRGYTGGIIGFTSGTHDMLELVRYYAKIAPGNLLTKYIPALEKVDGTAAHTGLETAFTTDWKKAAEDLRFREAQDSERDRMYFNPAVNQGKADGLHTLGQFIYYDAIVMHGPGQSSDSFSGIRAAALAKAKTPAQGGSENAYLNAFLDARIAAMKKEAAHDDTSRVDTAQRLFVSQGNFDLIPPLAWKVYGDSFLIK